MRNNQRGNDELRAFSIERGFQPWADGSVLIRMGHTHVNCAVTVEESVPPFLKDSGQGWITAEYGMLPCATHSRTSREAVRGRSGRTFEVQRLIGRSLRMMVDLGTLGPRTLRVDCDVLRADGGTRTAAITGSALAIHDALIGLKARGLLAEMPEITPVAAVSAGMVDAQPLLDLDYSEDSRAEADANFVMTRGGRLIEVQCTAEGQPLSRAQFDQLFVLAEQGIARLFSLWRNQDKR
ncbi:MAG: ribonuclease PH [Desulfobacterales bacterium]|nr:ribonuclease PH [Desulfobacterales bacterium]